MKQERFTYLMDRFVNKTISADEKAELRDLLNTQDEAVLTDSGVTAWLNEPLPALDPQEDEEDTQRRVNAILSIDKSTTTSPVVHRIHFLRKWGWAAAVLILLGAATYRWLAAPSTDPAVKPVAAHNDVAPGGNKAILTLGDGSTITLDSAANGSLTQQGNSAVVKLAGGQLAYRPTGAANDIVVMNTMSTPRGGQYQLTLPDGTKAWLNAASSITFPTAFITAQRKIKIKGEVYLEVAQDAAKPFIVDIDGRSVVEVLGTSFNVNSYPDEAAIKTTLIEGSVRIKTNDRNMLLKPGQQTVDMQLVYDADIAQVLAWKNGVFNFENLNFREVARQLERWYDIEVVYEGNVPDIQFKGDMNRGVSLTGVLRIFTAFGVHTRIEGRKLIVL